MATIKIEDLNENREMDREAMRSVVGGRSSERFLRPASPVASALLTRATNPSLFGWASLSPTSLLD